MKDSLKILAVKLIFRSVFGLCSLPFLSIIAQYVDSVTGFSSGNGYYTNSSAYIFKSPLVFIFAILCINIIVSIVCLITSLRSEK
jgi:hypothetical protein